MDLTIDFIRENFKRINKKHFGGKLLTPTFEITHVKSYLGQYHWQYSYNENIFRESVIRISDLFDRSERDIVNTIAHEMIHLYIRQNKIKDTRPHHGRVFYEVADRLNREGGFNISRTDSTEGCGLRVKTNQIWYIARFKDELGRYFAFSINQNYLDKYMRMFDRYKSHFDKWYIFKTSDDRYSRYTLCRESVRGRFIDKETFLKGRENECVIHHQ